MRGAGKGRPRQGRAGKGREGQGRAGARAGENEPTFLSGPCGCFQKNTRQVDFGRLG